ncbi:MAG: chromate transporter [Kiritimatiellae bacterium]|jgi:chromate transporter|nr:chromate transporter [Kiritimatiellia bacterium]
MIKTIFQLFYVFFKISICTTGGGYAMLPMFRRELIEKHDWVTDDEILNYYAIAQSIPGIIAVNVATFVGHKKAGFIGAFAAVVGIVMPSLVIIIIIAIFFNKFNEILYVQKALLGIRIAVASLLSVIAYGLMMKSLKNIFTVCVFVAVIIAIVVLKVSPIYVVLLSILAGVLYSFADKQNTKKQEENDDIN